MLFLLSHCLAHTRLAFGAHASSISFGCCICRLVNVLCVNSYILMRPRAMNIFYLRNKTECTTERIHRQAFCKWIRIALLWLRIQCDANGWMKTEKSWHREATSYANFCILRLNVYFCGSAQFRIAL